MAAGYTTKDIRNLAIVGHAGCGKTTLTERILQHTGVIGRMGTVEDGNTVCDFEPEEKAHQHSLSSALVHADVDGTHLNIIDTPGYPDFIGHAIGVLPAVETVCVTIDGGKGIENVTRRMMKLTRERLLPTAVVINKIDHVDSADLEALVDVIQTSFGKQCLPVNLPAKGGTEVLGCFLSDTGDADFSSVGDAHAALVDQVVETDDALMEKYLETGEVSNDELVGAFAGAMAQGHLVPILFVSAKEGTGIPEFLNIAARLSPSPLDGNPRTFVVKETADGEEIEWHAESNPEKPLVAHVFRIATDPFVGKLAAFRIHQGTIKSGDSVHVNDARKAVRLAHIFHLQGKDHTECEKAIPGDIVAVAKVEEMVYDAVLHNDTGFDEIRYNTIPQPKPMFGLAVTAAKRGEEGKVAQSLGRLADEDPTFIIDRDATTHEMVMRGIGELHLRVIIEKLASRFNLKVETTPPKIAYKETISAKADGHHRHKKQTGGAGQFGEVYLRVEPLPQDHETGFEFVDDTFGGSVPKQFMPAIEKGVKAAMVDGVIAGYPLQGVRVSVYDGKHHPVDSKEVAFVAAGKRAFMDAVSKAKPALLEPLVLMEITVPNDHMGDVTGDLAGRRGRVQGTDSLPGGQAVITATAPLSEVMTYASALKAMTQGTGSYTMEYSHDEATPPNVQAEIVKQFKPKEDDD